jgi:hypothetical protein
MGDRPRLMLKQRSSPAAINGTQRRDIGTLDTKLLAQMLKQICRYSLQRVQWSAAHCKEAELKHGAKTQALLVPRVDRSDIDRFEREEMRNLKLRKIRWQPSPAQERNVPRKHDLLPSTIGARSCNSAGNYSLLRRSAQKRDFWHPLHGEADHRTRLEGQAELVLGCD